MSHQRFYGSIIKDTFALDDPISFKEYLSSLAYKTSNAKIEVTVRRVRKIYPGTAYEQLDERTPGQRLRGALYKYWEKNESNTIKFEQFYENWVEQSINRIKDRI